METKARVLYLLRILEQYSDEDHPLSTTELIKMLLEQYGISSHRTTIKADVEVLQAYGVDIDVINSTQNKYYIAGRTFELPELKLLIDAVESSKFNSPRSQANIKQNSLNETYAPLTGLSPTTK